MLNFHLMLPPPLCPCSRAVSLHPNSCLLPVRSASVRVPVCLLSVECCCLIFLPLPPPSLPQPPFKLCLNISRWQSRLANCTGTVTVTVSRSVSQLCVFSCCGETLTGRFSCSSCLTFSRTTSSCCSSFSSSSLSGHFDAFWVFPGLLWVVLFFFFSFSLSSRCVLLSYVGMRSSYPGLRSHLCCCNLCRLLW